MSLEVESSIPTTLSVGQLYSSTTEVESSIPTTLSVGQLYSEIENLSTVIRRRETPPIYAATRCLGISRLLSRARKRPLIRLTYYNWDIISLLNRTISVESNLPTTVATEELTP